MFKNVLVNSFQKNFDSKWRNFLFTWNQGHVLAYLKNRIQWKLYPKAGKVSDFPLHVDIETTAKCNLRCPMCPSRHLSKEEYAKYGHMDFELYKKIVDECADHGVFSIRLSWRGEVLVNKRFAEYVHYAKRVRHIPNVSFLTNGSLLKGELARKLIEYGVDYISVSIDGLAPIYEQIRAPIRFEALIDNLRQFKELRAQMGRSKPMVRVTTLWPAIASDPQAFYDTLQPVCDKIVYNPLKDYNAVEPLKEGFICQFPWERLFVGFDGSVQPCSNTKETFALSNVRDSSLHEIWHSEPMQRLRSLHREGRRMEVAPCNTCSYGIDYAKLWQGRDWTRWDPSELDPRNNIRGAKND